MGDEIVAPINGRVMRIETDGKYNGVWVLADDGRVLTRQLYSDPSVRVGDRVRGGETVIGKQKDIEPFYGPKVPTHMHLDVFDPTRNENGQPRSGPVKTFGTRDYYRLDAKPALQRAPKYR